ncbi:hypothetical protein [Lentzea sp. NBRC 105346]
MARYLGISESAVRSNISLARQRLEVMSRTEVTR